ncbi:MAG TPA: hypothetical protein VFI79_10005 [Gemmatimonadales bacterium]|nr:hypothetical protein [Gemmatimonadales bacterium]
MKLRALMLLIGLVPPAVVSAMPGPLPFISDDVARARAEAKARHVPMFVDVWAPW